MDQANRKRGAWNQYYAITCVNLIAMAYGAGCVWTSPSLPILESVDTPLASGPITPEQSSWISAILCCGGICGAVTYAWITKHYGRKIPAVTTAIPLTISFLLIIYGTNVIYLICSRFFLGFAGGGLYLVIPQYTVEIAEDDIRGALGAIARFLRSAGFLLGYILGNYLSYTMFPWALTAFPVIFLCGVIFLPETPSTLMQQNKMVEAEKSLRFFRGYKADEKVHPEFTRELAAIREVILRAKDSKEERIEFKDFNTKVARKSIIIGITLIAVQELSGLFAMLSYSSIIFMESGSTLSPNMSSIVIGFIQLVASYVATILIDRAGRKKLLVSSGIGLFLASGSMSAFIFIKNSGVDVSEVSWLPLLCFSAVIFIGNVGVASVPYVVIAEMVPIKIKNVVLTALLCGNFSISFISLKSLSALVFLFGMHGLFLFYALVALFGAIFGILVLPETKGKSLEAIAELLNR